MARLTSLRRKIGEQEWEDIEQQGLVNSLSKAFGEPWFNRYVYKAIVNVALNSLRRTNRDKDLIDNLHRLSPIINLEALDLICDVNRVFEKHGYSSVEVHACYLYFCAGFTLREIVKIHHMSHTHWRRFFAKTRTRFRKELREYRLIPPRNKGGNGTK